MLAVNFIKGITIYKVEKYSCFYYNPKLSLMFFLNL